MTRFGAWPVLVVLLATTAPAAERVDEDPRTHWAFQRPARAGVPPVRNAAWVRNPIDAFIADSHEEHGLAPSPPAARHVLLRRLYLDLVGLPPTRDELHAFLADASADAYEKAVDRLLASPQYGERWGRHWMDVWRYSDWYGRRAVPDWWNSASQIWRWRDWIIKSQNADKPYDRMIREMLAADEIAPDDSEALAATGFLARNWYALNYNQWMRDSVEHTAKAFLGLTIQCAHCHDHKYDPITQEEYFRFRAFFEPLELRQDRVPGEADPGPFEKYQYSQLRKVVTSGLVRVFDERPDAPTYMYRLGDERNRFEQRPPVSPAAPAFLGGHALGIEAVLLPPAAYYPGLRPFVQQEELTRHEAAVADARRAGEKAIEALADARQKGAAGAQEVLKQAEGDALAAQAAVAAAEASRASLAARIAADKARYAEPPDAVAQELALAAEHAEREAAVCQAQENLVRAEAQVAVALAAPNPAEEKSQQDLAAARQKLDQARGAHDAALAALASEPKAAYQPLGPVYPRTSTGRRRALAGWITSSENPLTARVAVNHIWMRHFGRPLVASVFDFGRNGQLPTHPRLLDWLAVELIESGWSTKRLHRLIVTSNTYRMDSAGGRQNPNLGIDGDNRYLWRFPSRRVEAEVVRDSILHAAGELDPQLGGPELDNSLEPAPRRRSLYFTVHPEDGGRMKFLELFDAPDPCDCYQRSETIVPQQALALTNSRMVLNQGRLLARKLWEAAAPAVDDQTRESEFIVAAFEQILSRGPSPDEHAVATEFLRNQSDLFRTAAAPSAAEGAEGLVPPAADPAMRAREGLVRALFSHNDFVTIR